VTRGAEVSVLLFPLQGKDQRPTLLLYATTLLPLCAMNDIVQGTTVYIEEPWVALVTACMLPYLGLVRLAPNPHGLSGIGWV
jgi:hypothetical protein